FYLSGVEPQNDLIAAGTRKFSFPGVRNDSNLQFRLATHSVSFPKQQRADPHHCGPLFNGNFKIVTHTHRQFRKIETLRYLAKPSKVGPDVLGIVKKWRNRHQSAEP